MHSRLKGKFEIRPDDENIYNLRSRGRSQKFAFKMQPACRPVSIPMAILTVILQYCRKIIFFDIKLRIALYLACLFVISGLADVLPVPKFFIFGTNNVLNKYFVKLGWFWTLFVLVPFVLMTSNTYCCNKRDMVWKHMTRLLIATVNWYIWTNLFVYTESNVGTCTDNQNIPKPTIRSKASCIDVGFQWKGFDLSGHAFILVYSTLLLIEESRPFVNWDRIIDLINQEVAVRVGDTQDTGNIGPLRSMSIFDINEARKAYKKCLPWVRLNFILIAVLSLIWDFMLLSTIIYFHTMPEKLGSGLIAIAIWFFTYKFLYRRPTSYYCAAGDGLFTYNPQTEKPPSENRSRTNSAS